MQTGSGQAQSSAGGPRARRAAVIGDVGGHLDQLQNELSRLGADWRKARLPEELTVIQLGDLVHRGPASPEVLALVDRFLTNQPGQWVQLIGNHEAQYLGRPLFDWPEHLGDDAVHLLQQWWSHGQMQAAAAVVTGAESFLVTHAGLTADFWRRGLGAPADVEDAAAAINALIGSREDKLFRAGQMLGGGRGDRGAGPIWAAAGTELIPSWLGTPLPFSQIHGHASVYDWRDRRFLASAAVARLTTVDEAAKHEITQLDGGRIIGVDPGHGQQPREPWRAWEIDDVLTRV